MLVFSVNANATTQVIIGGNDDATNADEYSPITGAGSVNAYNWGTEAARQTLVPTAGTLSNLRVVTTTTPGAGNNKAFTLRVDGSSTALTCALGASGTSCQDSVNTVAVTAGQDIALFGDDTGNATAMDAHWTMVFTPTTADYTILTGSTSGGNLGTSGTEYETIQAQDVTETAEPSNNILISTAGTLRDLYVELATAPGVGTSRTFNLAAGVDCTIDDPATTCNSGADTVSVTAGTVYNFTSTVSGTPAASTARWGAVFVPNTSGYFMIAQTSSNSILTSAGTEYMPPTGGAGVWTSTETDADNLGQTMTIKNMYVSLSGSVGTVDDQAVFALSQDTVATALTCTITAGNSSCNITTDIAIDNDDLLSIENVTSSTPAAVNVRTTMTAQVATAVVPTNVLKIQGPLKIQGQLKI